MASEKIEFTSAEKETLLKALNLIKFLIRKWAKWRAWVILEHGAYKLEMDADFIASGVPEMLKLIEAEGNAIEEAEAKAKELENEHEYTKRQERKEWADKANAGRERITQMNKTTGALQSSAQGNRNKAAQFRTRSQFIRENF